MRKRGGPTQTGAVIPVIWKKSTRTWAQEIWLFLLSCMVSWAAWMGLKVPGDANDGAGQCSRCWAPLRNQALAARTATRHPGVARLELKAALVGVVVTVVFFGVGISLSLVAGTQGLRHLTVGGLAAIGSTLPALAALFPHRRVR